MLDILPNFFQPALSNNTPEMIRKELLDTNTVRLIARSSGLSAEDLASVQVAPERSTGWIEVYQTGKSDKAYNLLKEWLRSYVRARQSGHTREFVLAAVTNRVEPLSISDSCLRAIVTNQVMIPVSWLKKAQSGTKTNKAGDVVSSTSRITVVDGKSVTNETKYIPQTNEICQWARYILVDAEIGWHYFVQLKVDGSVDYIRDEKYDAKDSDPKYQKIIKDVEDEAHAEMKRDGSFGRFGSVHTFWHLKKEKLKAKGIEWRSPAELNRNINYD